MPLDALDALNDGFVDPSRPDQLPARLKGEEGLRLMQWLQAGGVNASLLRDVYVALRLQGEPYRAGQNLAGLREAIRSLIYARGFDQYPSLAAFLHEALLQLTEWSQWDGLLRYLQWLAQVMLMAGDRA